MTRMFSRYSSQRAATLVEFALMAVLAIGLFGAFIDITIGLSTYNELTSLTEDITRHVAVSRDSCRLSCESMDVRPFIEDDANLLKRFDELRADGAIFSAVLVNGGDRLRVSAQMPLNCIFCTFLSEDANFETVSESRLEVRTCFESC
jgi:hypothetical protein